MNEVNAVYRASYDDGEGADIVPCTVEIRPSGAIHVLEFLTPVKTRWYDQDPAYIEDETIEVEGYGVFPAIDSDKLRDTVQDDMPEKGSVVVYSRYSLIQAMSDSKEAARIPIDSRREYGFSTCCPVGTPGVPCVSETCSSDVQDAIAHLTRAIDIAKAAEDRGLRYSEQSSSSYYDAQVESCRHVQEGIAHVIDQLKDIDDIELFNAEW